MTASQPSRDISVRAVAPAQPPSVPLAGRLVAVIVGIDQYAHEAVPNLLCAVNDAESIAGAVRQTLAGDSSGVILLTSPARETQARRPTRDMILQAAQWVADSAGSDDTVLIYFAGHGGMLQGRPCLFPYDVALASEGDTATNVANAISIDELQQLFLQSRCPRRVMFLDCCQTVFSQSDVAKRWRASDGGTPGRALAWRTGLPMSSGLVEAFQQSVQGWSVLLACGPNEISLEDPAWGGHGIFSHFLAAGLRGEGDLDDDGVVSLPELVQYLAARITKQSEAIVDEASQPDLSPQPRPRQNPTMIWSGPIAVPLTRSLDERRKPLRRGVLQTWWHLLVAPLPYTLAVEGMVRYGTAVLYGLAMGMTVSSFAISAGWTSPVLPSVLIATASGLLWLSSVALAGAANEMRWHTGGYINVVFAVAWHVAVLLICLGLSPPSDPRLPELLFQLASALVVILSLMVIFGYNALQSTIALADLIKRDLRVAGRRAFVQLDRQWINADVDNTIAMVSAHPKLYLAVGLGINLLLTGHTGYVLFSRPFDTTVALLIARDFVLLMLIEWQVHWFAASYRRLRSLLLPER